VNSSSPIVAAHKTDRVRVYLASADKLLAALPDGSVDLLITDPPYVSVNRSSSTGSHLRDWFANGLTWPQIGHVFALAHRKLKPDGVLMAMTNNDGLREAIGALERAGFVGIRTITWDRRYPGLGGGLRHQTEFVLVGRLPGSRTLAGVDLVSVAAVGPGTADRYPTAKPDGLGRKLAAMAGIGPGSLAVDPFCGSGALLVGAAERGATVVGGDVAQRAVRLAGAKLARGATAGGRSTPGKPTGSGRSTTVARPVGTGRPAGLRPVGAGKPGKPTGSGRPNPTARPARAGKSSGSPRGTTAARPAGQSKPTAGRLVGAVKPTGNNRRSVAPRPVRTAKPTGSGWPTPAARPVSGSATRPARPGSRP
jgi:site-specific DNA-methyltransferase (adenine-specific)